ncbi:MAG: hypothetical protein J1E61_05960 [Lachnospiraceae bacterium]|nr:hypothetical protein [Lachnospiraceae bacterium]
MKENNFTAKSNEKSVSLYKNYYVKILYRLYRKIRIYAKKHFEKFSAMLIAITTICIWIIRSLGYTFQSAKFSVYNINKSYISLNDNFFLEIIEYIAIMVFWLFMNLIYFIIATQEDNNKFHIKRHLKKSLFFIFEILFILFISFLQSSYRILDVIREVANYTSTTWCVLLILLIFYIFIINLPGIRYAHLINKKNIVKGLSEDEKKVVKSNPLFSLLLVVFMVSFLTIYTYVCGMFIESQKSIFKVIYEESEGQLTDENVFELENAMICSIYAIVYENEDVYILCQLYKSDDGIKIDKKYQKIIPKHNIETYITNIYKIDYIN